MAGKSETNNGRDSHNGNDFGGPTDGNTADRAREWLIYLYSGEVTDGGRQAFSDWLRQSPEHARAYRRVENAWRGLNMAGAAGLFQPVAANQREPQPSATVIRLPDIKSDRRQTPSETQARPYARWKFSAAIAAAALVVLVAGVWHIQFPERDAIVKARYTTGIAEVKTVTLEDGSRITLDAASELVTAFSNEQRKANLIQGGAYFDVATDKKRQFVVAAAATEIRVIGTEFDVRKRAGDIRVSVSEGVVDVGTTFPDAENSAASQENSPRHARLRAGEQVSARLNGALGEVKSFDQEEAFAWRQGRLVFVDARLEDVIADINRYRDVKILLAGDGLRNVRISMVVPADKTDRVLVGLEASYPVAITESPLGISVKLKD